MWRSMWIWIPLKYDTHFELQKKMSRRDSLYKKYHKDLVDLYDFMK